jgi:hypothetical protein
MAIMLMARKTFNATSPHLVWLVQVDLRGDAWRGCIR